MALSNAERQRLWRKKQREENHEAYCRRERIRKQRTYVPTCKLSPTKQEERRKKCREDFRKHYIRKKKKQVKANEIQPTQTTCSPIPNMSTRSKGLMTVKLPFPTNSKAVGVRKRHNRSLKTAKRMIESLTKKCIKLEKDKKRVQKRAERARNISNEWCDKTLNIQSSSTPRSKTKLMLKKAGVRISKNRDVHKRLVLGNAMVEAMKAKVSQKKNKHSLNLQAASSIVKKYRCIETLSKEFGVTRRKLSKLPEKRLSRSMKSKYGEQVTTFLEREDNCTILPGKRDAKMKNKEATQKRILNDYLHNLYQKFILENPTIKLSKSSFCKLRPPHVLLTSFASRRTCLCTYHQNFALKIKSIQKEGIKCSGNPDVFVKEFDTSESLSSTLLENSINNDIKYRQWKKISDGDKYRWKEVEETVSKGDFIKIVAEELEKFRKHVQRVQNQYRELRKLRETLPENEVLLWMDFAENYGCSSVEEVQSAYWNAQMVSLHTMVVYFHAGHTKSVQSYVALSDSLSHNATIVYTILKKTIPLIKLDNPNLRRIHYLTDSPTSQYRNKTIFQIVCEHESDFGVNARWNYLECGHGKGPCDGLGASVKRSADMAVKQQKCLIQDASEFYKWVQREDSDSKVKYVRYSEQDIEEATEILKQKQPVQPIQGTMKIHAVAPVDSKTIATRELSCYCAECLNDVSSSSCSGWTIKPLVKPPPVRPDKPANDKTNEQLCITPTHSVPQANENESDTSNKLDVVVKQNEWVAVVYDDEWYIGKITDLDDDECQVNFLKKAGKFGRSYKFPTTRDELWVKNADILMIIDEMKEVGKSRRCYQLSENDESVIIDKYTQYTQ